MGGCTWSSSVLGCKAKEASGVAPEVNLACSLVGSLWSEDTGIISLTSGRGMQQLFNSSRQCYPADLEQEVKSMQNPAEQEGKFRENECHYQS